MLRGISLARVNGAEATSSRHPRHSDWPRKLLRRGNAVASEALQLSASGKRLPMRGDGTTGPRSVPRGGWATVNWPSKPVPDEREPLPKHGKFSEETDN